MYQIKENYQESTQKIIVNVSTTDFDNARENLLKALDPEGKPKKIKREKYEPIVLKYKKRSISKVSSILKDTLKRGRLKLEFRLPFKEKKKITSVIDRVVNLKIENESMKKYRKQQFCRLINKINYFIEKEEFSKAEFNEIIKELNEALEYLPLISATVESYRKNQALLAKIRNHLSDLYITKNGKQKVR